MLCKETLIRSVEAEQLPIDRRAVKKSFLTTVRPSDCYRLLSTVVNSVVIVVPIV